MTDQLIRQMRETLPADAWPQNGHTLVIGVSGGSDSVALAHLLDRLNTAECCGWTLHVGHLDHGLRGAESVDDARFVADLAERRGWPCTIEHCDVRQRSTQDGRSVEDAARQARYTFFEQLLEDTGAHVVATAHTADDNAETILHRLLRGTGLRGLAGIPAMRPIGHGTLRRIIRPLLRASKAELVAALKAADLSYREDTSNALLEPTRNRIRRQLLPQLEADYNPQLKAALLRVGLQCRWWNEYLDGVLEKLFGDVALEVGRGHVVISAKALCKLPDIMRTEVIRRAVKVIGAHERRLTFQHYLTIAEFATRDVSGKQLELPDGLRVHRKRDQLRIAVLQPHDPEQEED